MSSSNRVLLGIKELDQLLKPGLVKGSVVLIAGHPGVGKTTFAAQVVRNHIELYNRKALMISFAENKEDFYTYMNTLGFNFKDYEKTGKFKFISLLTISDIDLTNKIVEALMEFIEEYTPNIVVIDGFTALVKIMRPSQLRAFLHSTLIPILKENSDLSLLISDLPIGGEIVGYGIEEFIVDVVILMKLVKNGPVYERIMEFRKARGAPLRNITVPYVIKPNIGIKPLLVILDKKKQARYVKFNMGLPEEPIGEIPCNTQLLITGPSGAGKSVLVAHITSMLAKNGCRIAYISLDETSEMVVNRFASLGYKDVYEMISVKTIDVNMYTLSETVYEIFKFIEEEQPDVVVIDGIRVLQKLSNEELFWRELVRITTTLRKMNIMGIYVYTGSYPEEKIPIDTLVDIIVIARHEIRDNKVERTIIIWKNRFGPTPSERMRVIIEYGKGIKIKGVEKCGRND